MPSQGGMAGRLRINEQYPQFAPQYPQLAVAIGGANPELPSVAESVADFKGLSRPTYTA